MAAHEAAHAPLVGVREGDALETGTKGFPAQRR
jgi:hypothetical protein